jgi:hypothetical protein
MSKSKAKMKIKQKSHNLIFTFFMNLGMCLYMSLCMHLVNVGPHSFETIFVKNFFIAFALSLPFSYMLVAFIAKMLNKYFTPY